MSTEVSKTVYRIRLKELDEKDDDSIAAYFTDLLGFPEDLESSDDGLYIDYGAVEYLPRNYEGKFKDFLRPVVSEAGEWGLDLVICTTKDGECRGWDVNVAQGWAVRSVKIRSQLFLLKRLPAGAIAAGEIHSYTWYNGVDEPICFGRPADVS